MVTEVALLVAQLRVDWPPGAMLSGLAFEADDLRSRPSRADRDRDRLDLPCRSGRWRSGCKWWSPSASP